MHPINFIITKTVGNLFLLKSIGGFINGFWFDVNHVSNLYESGPELTSAGLKHSVTAKLDTPCNSIRFIIFYSQKPLYSRAITFQFHVIIFKQNKLKTDVNIPFFFFFANILCKSVTTDVLYILKTLKCA